MTSRRQPPTVSTAAAADVFARGPARRLAACAARLAAAAVLLAVTACASLPSGVQRPVSTALPSVATAPLARVAAASVATSVATDAPAASGFRLLADGGEALDARLTLIRRAERSVDVQYYLIAHDRTGLEFLGELSRAADRGVRVRILVDDLYASGQDALLAGLAARGNVEVRLFNPLPVRRGGLKTRVVLSLHEFGRINGRMHNKLLVVDNAFAVTGGRNIADEYFGRGGPANFIDMDVLAAGPVVGELSTVFDRYWNSDQAYPVQSLAGTGDPAAAASAGTGAAPAISKLAREIDQGRVDLTAAAVEVVADAPAKAGGRAGDAPQPTVMDRKLALLGAATTEVLDASPYFIPGQRGMAAMRRLVADRVRVDVLTNSLSTTDEPMVHSGYTRYRAAMLALGVSLYELMPNRVADGSVAARVHDGDIGSSGSSGASASLGRLHAKVAVVDRRHLFIGSMNMDGRSARHNTEMALVIDSTALAGEAAALLHGTRNRGSYRLRIAAAHGGIEWLARGAEADGAGVVHAAEPMCGLAAQLGTWMTSLLIDEDLL